MNQVILDRWIVTGAAAILFFSSCTPYLPREVAAPTAEQTARAEGAEFNPGADSQSRTPEKMYEHSGEPASSMVESVPLEEAQDLSPTGIPWATSKDKWLDLQARTPEAHTTPLADSEHTAIDGVYAKLDPNWPQWWQCRRCADYRPAGGIWKLQFDRGIMRIYYDVTGWHSIGSYAVTGDRLFLFNDPYCPEAVGEYHWSKEDQWGMPDRILKLEVTQDGCSIDLRGQNLSSQPWMSCSPPNEMTAASDHWRKPPGCEPPDPSLLTVETGTDLNIEVVVHEGYTRDFSKPPDMYVNAVGDPDQMPAGITVSHSDESIPYGLNRVLYGEGDWVEASAGAPFDAIGVQIFGDDTIGWARVLFDGLEVWRGDTSKIWSQFGRFGGYIEITGFETGTHTIRVESLGFDYHPVTVAYFGFSEDGAVKE